MSKPDLELAALEGQLLWSLVESDWTRLETARVDVIRLPLEASKWAPTPSSGAKVSFEHSNLCWLPEAALLNSS